MNKSLVISKSFFVSILTMCIFAIIDSTIFLFFEKDLDNYLKQYDIFDEVSRDVFLGGMAAAIAILVANIIKEYLILPNFKFKESSLTEFIGCISGTIIVVIIYSFYKKI